MQARLRVWGKVTTFVHLGFWAAWLAGHRGGVDLSRDAPLVMEIEDLLLRRRPQRRDAGTRPGEP